MVGLLGGVLRRVRRGGGRGLCGGATAGADRCSSSTPGTKRFGGRARPRRVMVAGREPLGAWRSVCRRILECRRAAPMPTANWVKSANSGGGARSSADVHHAQHRCLRAAVAHRGAANRMERPWGKRRSRLARLSAQRGAERPRVRPQSASRVESLTARLADRTGADDRSRTRNLLFTKQLL